MIPEPCLVEQVRFVLKDSAALDRDRRIIAFAEFHIFNYREPVVMMIAGEASPRNDCESPLGVSWTPRWTASFLE
jgi:hypothetical protein